MSDIYNSSFSGEQIDDAVDKVINKKITAEDVGSMHVYKSLQEVSSSLTTDSTPFEVANAMQDNSMLLAVISGSATYAGGLVPQAENGLLRITKHNIARVVFEFFGEHSGVYNSFLRSVAGNFKGWRRDATVTAIYTGTGTYGSDNPNTLTLTIEPSFLFIRCGSSKEIAFYAKGLNSLLYIDESGLKGTPSDLPLTVTKSGVTTILSWYGSNASSQLNTSGTKYYCVAIG